MKSGIVFCVIVAAFQLCVAQLVVNGNFQSGGTGWGCGAIEVNPETVYGGVTAANVVAEVDILANLCQNISGLTIGQSYDVSFIATRRNGGCPGPNPVDAYVRVDGGALVQLFSRSGAWSWVASTYSFIANNTTHQLTFTAGPTQTTTCGILIDDVSVVPTVIFPVAIDLQSRVSNGKVELTWLADPNSTETAYFVERKSSDLEWQEIQVEFHRAESDGDWHSALDQHPVMGAAEYRLRSVTNGAVTYSNVISVEANTLRSAFSLTYNPNEDAYFLQASAQVPYTYKIVDLQGKMVGQSHGNEGSHRLEMNGLNPGIYLLKIRSQQETFVFKFARY